MGLINVSSINVGLYAIVLGVLLSAIYDFFAVFINLLKGNSKVIFILDIIFMFLSAIITYLYLIGANFGVFRAYVIFAELIGFIIYRLSLGRLNVKLIKTLLHFVYKIHKVLFMNFAFILAAKIIKTVKNYFVFSFKNVLALFFPNKVLCNKKAIKKLV